MREIKAKVEKWIAALEAKENKTAREWMRLAHLIGVLDNVKED